MTNVVASLTLTAYVHMLLLPKRPLPLSFASAAGRSFLGCVDLALSISYAPSYYVFTVVFLYAGSEKSLISQETIVSGGVHAEAPDFAVLEGGEHALCSYPLSP
jgi:hypothetical protein